jgi:hypothetical protein
VKARSCSRNGEQDVWELLGTPRNKVVLVRDRSARGFVYGFAARPTLAAAELAAKVELERNRWVLENHDRLSKEQKEELGSVERRLLYFASEAGVYAFDARIRAALTLNVPAKVTPHPFVDCEITGPWSRYAFVWRYMVVLPPEAFGTQEDFFLF